MLYCEFYISIKLIRYEQLILNSLKISSKLTNIQKKSQKSEKFFLNNFKREFKKSHFNQSVVFTLTPYKCDDLFCLKSVLKTLSEFLLPDLQKKNPFVILSVVKKFLWSNFFIGFFSLNFSF